MLFGFFIQSEKITQAAPPAPNISSTEVYQTLNNKSCGFFTGCSVAGEDLRIKMGGISYSNGMNIPNGTSVSVSFIGKGGCFNYDKDVTVTNGSIDLTVPGDSVVATCTYSVRITVPEGVDSAGETIEKNEYNSPYSQPVQAACSEEQCSDDLDVLSSNLYELCAQIKTGTPQHSACLSCFTGQGIWTAIGCIPSNPEEIIKTIIVLGLSFGGGVVLIMILVGSFMLSVSQGDPNKTKEAKEIITSAIIGLLFVIFSVTILQFIGVEILHIPGFGE